MALSKIGSDGLVNDAVGPNQLDETANYAFTGTVTGTPVGVTEADQWCLSSGFTPASEAETFVNSGWARNITSQFEKIGTGMTESSGTFTFPSTGIYLIKLKLMLSADYADQRLMRGSVYVTTDNSSYDKVVYGMTSAYGSQVSNQAYCTSASDYMFDVTNTTTHKVRIYSSATVSGITVRSDAVDIASHVTFIKLGDT